jgi:hypothetical protein
MADWKFWQGFLAGAAAMIPTLFTVLKGIAELKSFFSNQAKPQLLDVQNCRISIGSASETFHFELLVNNAGSKDCSVISVELKLPNGDISQFVWAKSTELPKTIAAGQTERITRDGQCGGVAQYGKYKVALQRPVLQSQKNFVEGTLTVKFNTNKIIKKKTTFTIGSFDFYAR